MRVVHGRRVSPSEIICTAIRKCQLIEFDYDGLHRVVAPYCHGHSSKGELLRGVQMGGESRSPWIKSGKLWSVSKMVAVTATSTPFVPDDPEYNPFDSSMVRIHCHLRSLAVPRPLPDLP